MASDRTRFNPKRRFASNLPAPETLKKLADGLRYGGNSEHKRNPGDFALTPPCNPRSHKSLCDNIRVFKRAEALKLLRHGARAGMISEWDGNGYPKNIWSMSDDGVPLEAQRENPADGTYHGYPMDEKDPFRKEVIAQWKKRATAKT